jgi:hypothetical protein
MISSSFWGQMRNGPTLQLWTTLWCDDTGPRAGLSKLSNSLVGRDGCWGYKMCDSIKKYWLTILIFFYFSFLIIVLEMDSRNFFLNLTLLSRINPSDATYEEVTSSVHLTWLKGLARARSPRWSGWHHIVLVTLVRSAWLMFKSR